jgi:hypothetical protein
MYTQQQQRKKVFYWTFFLLTSKANITSPDETGRHVQHDGKKQIKKGMKVFRKVVTAHTFRISYPIGWHRSSSKLMVHNI